MEGSLGRSKMARTDLISTVSLKEIDRMSVRTESITGAHQSWKDAEDYLRIYCNSNIYHGLSVKSVVV